MAVALPLVVERLAEEDAALAVADLGLDVPRLGLAEAVVEDDGELVRRAGLHGRRAGDLDAELAALLGQDEPLGLLEPGGEQVVPLLRGGGEGGGRRRDVRRGAGPIRGAGEHGRFGRFRGYKLRPDGVPAGRGLSG